LCEVGTIDIAIGPFIGSWETEVLFFKPYVTWLMSVLKPVKVYVASHKSRKFLYTDPRIIFLPVFEDFTRNEFGQCKATHSDVSSKDYNIIIKKFKSDILSRSAKGDDIFYYNIPYNKNPWIPEYKRIHGPLPVTKTTTKYPKILFIPDDNESEELLRSVYNGILTSNKPTVIGDMRTWLPEYNVLLRDPKYFTNVYQTMVNYISNASGIICPSSVWTSIADLHNVPCFSWGRYTPSVINKKTIILNNDELTHHTIIELIQRTKWLQHVPHHSS
jgi:hypothetical protein